MLGGPIGSGKGNTLMSEYSLKLGEAVLRSRTRLAEKAARIEADIAHKIKSEFISNMSHELRTPLNTVIGFSKLIAEHDQRPLGDPEIVEYARLIQDASSNLLAIINDILDISKIQAGHFRIDTNDVNLDEILEVVIASARTMAAQAGVSITAHIDDVDSVVKGDALKLKQVFSNLIGNAIKFTAAGGSVTVETEVESDGAVGVFIRDTGVGMDEEEIKVALSPFGQVDGTRTRWREGTGLGLPIAKALVELHGGRLTIHSGRNTGTEISVRLPPPGFYRFMQQDLGFQIANN